MRLQNKTAIVTGAAHGIGRAIAELFAEEGARVFLADIDSKAGQAAAAGIRERGGDAAFIRCDVGSAVQVASALKRVSKTGGQIDILCNNAAFLAKRWHSAGEATDNEWEKCVRVSLMGAQYFTRAVLPSMVRQRSGSIINISSIQGLVGGRNSAAYTTV
jgi:NAD(P)-dependent dehydrogenase (short-subunit alcohol dehydrogenase family)